VQTPPPASDPSPTLTLFVGKSRSAGPSFDYYAGWEGCGGRAGVTSGPPHKSFLPAYAGRPVGSRAGLVDAKLSSRSFHVLPRPRCDPGPGQSSALFRAGPGLPKTVIFLVQPLTCLSHRLPIPQLHPAPSSQVSSSTLPGLGQASAGPGEQLRTSDFPGITRRP